MRHDQIDVAMAIDDTYVEPAVVMATSMARTTAARIRLHVIDGGLSPGRGEEMARTLHPHVEVRTYTAPDPLVLDLPEGRYNDYLSSASMTRLQMAQLFDDDVERVLYVDADLLVLQDVLELWTADLRGRCVGAVRDAGWPDRRTFVGDDGHAHETYQGATVPGYFNSGVMVIDLGGWRAENVFERCRDLHVAVGNELRAPDQDMLNAVLEGAWTPLPAEWNTLILRLEDPAVHLDADQKWKNFLVSQEPGPGRDEWSAHLAARRGIVHYSGRRKPWHADFPDGPLKDIWTEHALDAREITGAPLREVVAPS